MQDFQIIVQNQPGFGDVSICIAACRAGEMGVLNLEFIQDKSFARQAVRQLTRFTNQPFGLKLNTYNTDFVADLTGNLSEQIHHLIFPSRHPENLSRFVPALRKRGIEVLLEVTDTDQATYAQELGVDGLIAKGNEAGGWVGEETTFILLQRLLKHSNLPVWASGGIGLHTIAACYVAGAAGVVLDDQLALTRESQLPDSVKAAIAAMDGSETLCLGLELGRMFRAYTRPDATANQTTENDSLSLVRSDLPEEERMETWERTVTGRVGFGSLREQLWPIGQAAAFAKPLADRFKTVGGILKGMRGAMLSHANAASQLRPLDQAAPLAHSHQTRYPIVQGPMTRVSDRAEFALKVAEGGGLPFLALALMREKEVAELLQETKQILGDRPWGVGILGFVPLDLRQEQMTVIRQYAPPYAIIAGGRPDQARALEADGIPTYLHIPSPSLLRLFIKNGARRFIFEGRECGGHVGPRSSFVLWDTMVDVLLENLPESEASSCHVLFAGGVHDRVSSAMVAALAAPLAERGIRIGILMGTAYLFTKEAVSSGAILSGFQEEALHCENTTLLESGPGHATRCVPTPFVETFKQEKLRLQEAELSSEAIRSALEDLNVGRLRIASKGITRHERYERGADVSKYVLVNAARQHQDGMYMIGQVAALRRSVTTVEELHREVSVEGSVLLEGLIQEEEKPAEPSHPSSIAIIGMSCILPGAKNLQAYWENILDKVDSITDVPKDRWDWQRYFDLDQKARDKVYSRWGGFIDAIPFNPLDYGMPPNSIPSIEPLQLLMLEVVKAGLTDAGYLERPFPRERTAVVVGVGGGQGDLGYLYSFRSYLPHFLDTESSDTVEQLKGRLPEWTEDSFPGILLSVVAGRIANRFDLGGPNFTVDAACASSLAALDIATKDLEAGRTDMAIVGGGDTVQSPFGFLAFSKTHALSPSGRCRPFDADADGIAISEGLAVVVLKRLEDAERDGDRIYAVIRGIGGSSDGRDKSLTAPRPAGQLLALRRAYDVAGFAPDQVGLIEAHGTGTRVGDAVEIESLRKLLPAQGQKSIAIGSVKSMIGHTKSTAGLAGLIKVALSLYHKILPPTLVDQLNPKLDLDQSQVYVNGETRPWLPAGNAPRRAGVSAFGFGGVNFHTVLEEYQNDFLPAQPVRQHWPAELFLWRAVDPEALRRQLISLKEWLVTNTATNSPPLRDIAYSLYKEFQESKPGSILAIVANAVEDLTRKIRLAEAPLRTGAETFEDAQGVYYAQNPSANPAQIAFLFPGQGSQYPNMVRELALYFPRLRVAFEQANTLLQDKIPGLSDYIFPTHAFTEEESRAQRQALTATQIAQPALGATGLALSRLLKDMDVHPAAVAGHSYGEIVALHEAGVIDEASLFAISETRGRLMAEAAGPEAGTMAAISASSETTAALLGARDNLTLANLNAPNQTVISGTNPAVEQAVRDVQAMGIQAQMLPVACAFHSPLVAPASERFAAFLQTIPLNPPQKPVFSNTTGQPYPKEPEAIRQLLSEHLARPVVFQKEIEAMYASGIRIFVETGPRTVLTVLVKQILGDRPHLAISVDQPGRFGLMAWLKAVGQLTAAGIPVNLAPLFDGRSGTRLNFENSYPSPEHIYGPTTWLVSGGKAVPWEAKDSQPKIEAPLRVKLTGEVPALPDNIQPTMRAAQPPPTTPTPSPGNIPPADEVSQVMMQYQQMMSQFLETQKSIMLAYLGAAPENSLPPPAQMGDDILNTAPAHAPEQEIPSPTSMGEASPEHILTPSEPASAQNDDGSDWTTENITTELLSLFSERTGYPIEMLDLDANMEGDLGIDSIKRVEILSVFQERHPWLQTLLADDGMEQLQTQKTIRAISEWISTQPPTPQTPTPSSNISRFTLSIEDLPLNGSTVSLPKDKVIFITDDGLGISRALANLFTERGHKVVIATTNPADDENSVAADFTNSETTQSILDHVRRSGQIGALVHLAPLRTRPDTKGIELEDWQDYFQTDVMSFFNLVRGIFNDLISVAQNGKACVLIATEQGGMFSGSGANNDTLTFCPGDGGLVGMLKTIGLEMPSVRVRAIDFNRLNGESETNNSTDFAAETIFEELMSGDTLVEVGYDGKTRKTVGVNNSPIIKRAKSLNLDEESVILLTGGARGITAEVAKELAERYRPTLILVGRSPMPSADESPQTANLTETRAIKEALISQLNTNGHKPSLREVETAYTLLTIEREIRANLTALAQTGARVHYYSLDVRDEQAFGELIDKVYMNFGRLDGVIHGAGIIEDKLLKDKTPSSFERVVRTKVDSALILKEKLRPDSLQFLVFFTSVSGRFGNKGQSDYALANEVLNKLAIYLDQHWPARVLSVNWGPWEGTGMVSTALQKEFARRGVSLIPVEVGRQRFVEELLYGMKGDVEVLICSEDTQGMAAP